ncbi:hypothetical protein [Streptomyces sp. WAC 06725]|uniref:hypothetical protein n=1 Tax=Streptomyces sp. WAC 06725 TaxID=2203209 RepID=UPI000F740898|nr:hypothetical protein [Streptomyces sp. WAC 06725]
MNGQRSWGADVNGQRFGRADVNGRRSGGADANGATGGRSRRSWFSRPLSPRPDTAGHPAHYTAANRPHSPPGAGAERTPRRAPALTVARAASRTPVRTPIAPGREARARMRTAPSREPRGGALGTRRHGSRQYETQAYGGRPHRSSLRPLTLLGVLAVVLTLLFSGTAAGKGGKTPLLPAAATAPAQASTPTPAAPPGAHGTPTELSPTTKPRTTGIQYRRDNERDAGREKEKDRNHARRCTRTAQGAPCPNRRPTPPYLRTARSHPVGALSSAHLGTTAASASSRPGVSTRPALHCLHCVFRC